MLTLLKYFNYSPPKIISGEYGNVTIEKNNNTYFLKENENQWMMYNEDSHAEAYEVFSHYFLSFGHVVVTGLGFGVRENWILSKPEVNKLTIIEKNKNILEYHEKNKSPFLKDPRVSIIIADASEYKISCDSLFLDHYEMESSEEILNDVEKIQSNIDCKVLWFWPLERIIMLRRKWHSDRDYPYDIISKHDAYNLIKNKHNLNKLPNLNKDDINLFCMLYNSKLFSQSEDYFEVLFSDRKVFHDIYTNI